MVDKHNSIIITLNVSGPCTLNKRQRLSTWGGKKERTKLYTKKRKNKTIHKLNICFR